MSIHSLVATCPPYIQYGCQKLPGILDRLRSKEVSGNPLHYEEVLTYLCAYGYALDPDGPRQLASVLLEGTPPQTPGTGRARQSPSLPCMPCFPALSTPGTIRPLHQVACSPGWGV
jgi:hypothetical protein